MKHKTKTDSQNIDACLPQNPKPNYPHNIHGCANYDPQNDVRQHLYNYDPHTLSDFKVDDPTLLRTKDGSVEDNFSHKDWNITKCRLDFEHSDTLPESSTPLGNFFGPKCRKHSNLVNNLGSNIHSSSENSHKSLKKCS